MGIDTVTRKRPECGVVLVDDFNHFKDNFLVIIDLFKMSIAILDKIWTNMTELYSPPLSISELGKSDHNMLLLRPMFPTGQGSGGVTRVTIKSMGVNEKAKFSTALPSIRWEPLFIIHTCEEK